MKVDKFYSWSFEPKKFISYTTQEITFKFRNIDNYQIVIIIMKTKTTIL